MLLFVVFFPNTPLLLASVTLPAPPFSCVCVCVCVFVCVCVCVW